MRNIQATCDGLMEVLTKHGTPRDLEFSNASKAAIVMTAQHRVNSLCS
jgi:hypothetical protein